MANGFDIAWAAGFFEGEGCLRVTPRDHTVLAVVSTDRDVLERFNDVVGVGSIHLRPAPIKDTHRQQWAWQVGNAADVRKVVVMLAPFFGVRRAAKADEVLACCDRIEGRRVLTHCKHGHPYDDENTYVYNNTKFCRTCQRAASARYRAKAVA